MTSLPPLSKISEARIKNLFDSVYTLLQTSGCKHYTTLSIDGIKNLSEIIKFICNCIEEPPLTKEEVRFSLTYINEALHALLHIKFNKGE